MKYDVKPVVKKRILKHISSIREVSNKTYAAQRKKILDNALSTAIMQLNSTANGYLLNTDSYCRIEMARGLIDAAAFAFDTIEAEAFKSAHMEKEDVITKLEFLKKEIRETSRMIRDVL